MKDSNVDERIKSFMARKKVDLTENVRFKRLRTAKWYQYLAAGKGDLLG